MRQRSGVGSCVASVREHEVEEVIRGAVTRAAVVKRVFEAEAPQSAAASGVRAAAAEAKEIAQVADRVAGVWRATGRRWCRKGGSGRRGGGGDRGTCRGPGRGRRRSGVVVVVARRSRGAAL